MRELLVALLLCAGTAVAQAGAPPPPARGRVEGVLLGQQGEPLPNVEVVASRDPRGDEVLARGRTDAQGMFVLGRLPTDRGCTVLARVPGHTTAVEYARLGPDRPHAAVQLRAWQANTLRGRVVDPTGAPVAGAYVLGSKDHASFDGRFLAAETRADDDGRFELHGVPIGDCVVLAWAEGRAMRSHWLTAAADAEVEVRLPRGAGTRLRVRVEGLPADVARAATVGLSAARAMFARVQEQRLDDAGGLVIEGLLDAQWTVVPTAPGYTFEPRRVRIEPGDRDAEATFRAVADGSVVLRGVLRDGAGRPLPGERLVGRAQQGGVPGEAVTDGEGRFALRAPLVAGEPYTLQLVDSAWVLDQRERPENSWAPRDPRYLVRWEERADPSRQLELVATRAARVEARLVDERGAPVPFVRTELQVPRPPSWIPRWSTMEYATSARDGALAFPGVHAIDEHVRIVAAGPAGAGTSEPFRLRAGELTRVTVAMQRPGRVVGTVRDQNGAPLVGVRVSLGNNDLETEQQLNGTWMTVPSDREGRFVFVGVAPGGHRVAVGLRRKADGTASSSVFEVAAGETFGVDVEVRR